ncbi:MAG: hypothetical protein KDA28_08000, partial [Phycisphaerales bacterium]|nr:hypothetical protein [Phycisphaerales bacterium]
PGGVTTQYFADSIAIEGERIAVAGTLLDQPFGPPQAARIGGAIHLFERQSPGTWVSDGVVVRTWSPGYSVLGGSLDLDGDRFAVASSGSDETPFGPIPSSTTDANGAFVYSRTAPGTWDPVDDFAGEDFEGPLVRLHGDVGICSRAVSAFGVANAGVVASYSRSTGSWNRVDVEIDPVASDGVHLLDLRDGGSGRLVAPGYSFDEFGHPYLVVAVKERQPSGSYGSATVIPIDESDPFVSQPTSISIDGDVIVLGAATQGVKTRPDHTRGRAYVLERDSFGQWNQVAVLEDAVPDFTNPITDDTVFASRVLVDGDRIAVGGVTGSQKAGRVHVFERDPFGAWLLADVVLEPVGTAVSGFAHDLAVSGDTLFVAAPNYTTTGGALVGAVHVVERQTNGTWIPIQTIEGTALTCTTPTSFGQFAQWVRASGDELFIGAPGLMSILPPSVVPGGVHVLRRDPLGVWQYVDCWASPSGSGEEFGLAMDVDGDEMLVTRFTKASNPQITFQLRPIEQAVEYRRRMADGSWQTIVEARRWTEGQLLSYGRRRTDVLDGAGFVVYAEDDFEPTDPIGPGERRYDDGLLWRSRASLDVPQGDSASLFLRAGEPYGGDLYIILGSLTGPAVPGIPVGSTGLVFPLVRDIYTRYILDHAGGSILQPYLGFLDAYGRADAALTLEPNLWPNFVG